MNRFIRVTCIIIFSQLLKAQTAPGFTIHIISSSNSITCTNPVVNLIASSSYSVQMSYSWAGPAGNFSGSNVNISQPGTYVVTASAPNIQSSAQNVVIGIDTIAPVSSLSPSLQTITCSNASLALVNAASNIPTNISHHFMSPSGGTFVASTPTAAFNPWGPGTYTHTLINNINGCITGKTFSVLTSSGFPTFSVVSAQSFSLGCASYSNAVVSINSAATSPTMGGPLSYTLLSPQTSGSIPPGTLSAVTNYSLNMAGSYTLITRDNTSFCETRVPVTIIQNTLAPNLKVIVPNQILNCTTPQVQLQATSDVTNVSYNWSLVGTPNSILGNTISVATNIASPTTTLINTYTLTGTNDDNSCETSTIIPIYQNIFQPVIAISMSTLVTLTCYNPTIALTNQCHSGIPPGSFSANLPVVSSWTGPQLPSQGTYTSVYIASTSGVYGVIATDLNNGCTASNTSIPIFDGEVYPVVNNPSGPAPFCINSKTTSVVIYPIISGSMKDCVFQWTAPPSANINGVNADTLRANAIGIYTIIVTNTVSGCSTMGQVIVADCITGISKNSYNEPGVSVYPNPSNGVFTIDHIDKENETEIRVYNLPGVLCKKYKTISSQNILDLSDETNGIYFLYIIENNIPVYISKLIKQ